MDRCLLSRRRRDSRFGVPPSPICVKPVDLETESLGSKSAHVSIDPAMTRKAPSAAWVASRGGVGGDAKHREACVVGAYPAAPEFRPHTFLTLDAECLPLVQLIPRVGLSDGRGVVGRNGLADPEYPQLGRIRRSGWDRSSLPAETTVKHNTRDGQLNRRQAALTGRGRHLFGLFLRKCDTVSLMGQ